MTEQQIHERTALISFVLFCFIAIQLLAKIPDSFQEAGAQFWGYFMFGTCFWIISNAPDEVAFFQPLKKANRKIWSFAAYVWLQIPFSAHKGIITVVCAGILAKLFRFLSVPTVYGPDPE